MIALWLLLAGTAVAQDQPTLPPVAVEEDIFAGIGAPPFLEPPTPEVVEARTEELAKILRCPVCQGLSVADSRENASLAMKSRIEEMVAAGYSDEQVVDYFVDRYGEWVLLKPDSRHWVVWLSPFIAGGIGFGVVVLAIRRQRLVVQTTTEAVSGQASPDPYRARILAELGEEEMDL